MNSEKTLKKEDFLFFLSSRLCLVFAAQEDHSSQVAIELQMLATITSPHAAEASFMYSGQL